MEHHLIVRVGVTVVKTGESASVVVTVVVVAAGTTAVSAHVSVGR